MTTHLQGIGSVNAKPAKDIKVGDTLIWNYGCKSKIENVEFSKTRKTLTITERYESDIYTRKLGANRLVACE